MIYHNKGFFVTLTFVAVDFILIHGRKIRVFYVRLHPHSKYRKIH